MPHVIKRVCVRKGSASSIRPLPHSTKWIIQIWRTSVPLDEAEIPETEIPELDSSFDDDDEGYIDEDRENGDD